MSSTLKGLVFTRGHKRKQITELNNEIVTKLNDLTVTRKRSQLTKLKTLQTEMDDLDKKVCSLKFDENADDSAMTVELDEIGDYRDKIVESIVILEGSLAESSVPNSQSTAFASNTVHSLRPPVAPLPKYGGTDSESLERFLTAFEAVVSKYSYSSYEKYILLKNQISGRALSLIESLEANKQSYEDAKELLTLALASPLTQRYEAVQKLVDLKLAYGKDPYLFVSEMRVIQETFRTLEISVDLVLQYFIWRGMNSVMQNQLINITNETKPSLESINKNIFVAVERYQLISKKYNDKSKLAQSGDANDSAKNSSVGNYAIDVNYRRERDQIAKGGNSINQHSDGKNPRDNFKYCSLCGIDSNHPIYKCDKFPSPLSKLNKLKIINGCCKCSYLNHATADCKFKFNSKCKKCSGDHFAFLCSRDPRSGSNDGGTRGRNIAGNPGSSGGKTTSSVIWAQTMKHSGLDKSNALPTFTCKLGDDLVRVMLDSGCQTNFILRSVAEEQHLRVVSGKVKLTVNGFNCSKVYDTNIVSVPLNLNDKVVSIDAVVVPDIDINLSLPNLGKVVNLLLEKNYVLADKLLTKSQTSIDNIALILGSESAHCIPVSTFIFGNSKPSSLLQSPEGIMLQGDLNTMLQNCDYLQDLSCGASVGACSRDIGCFMEQGVIDDLNGSMRSVRCTASEAINHEQPESGVCAAGYIVVDEGGEIDSKLIENATDEILNSKVAQYLNYDDPFEEQSVETNESLVQFVLDRTVRLSDGRLQMPLLWNSKVSHLLGINFNLSRKILQSNFRKLSKIPGGIGLTDDVFREQEASGVLERIDNLDQFMEMYPNCSFLPHMSVMKPDRDTTKCRVVYLSNLCEKNSDNVVTLCHNQVIHSGPNLNKKIITSLLLLRFDKLVLTFDIKKAFLNIALDELDQSRLLVLWFRNVCRKDYSVVAYKAKRLPFGISCSPALLMLALYKILMLDIGEDSPKKACLKRLVYSLIYMDNGAVCCNSVEDLEYAYRELNKIFAPYQFCLQQFVTNFAPIQAEIDSSLEEDTPVITKLFGLLWNRVDDTMCTRPLHLNGSADTKRACLKSFAENFDPFGLNGPLLNRARLFVHEIQSDATVDWDTKLCRTRQNLWRNISNQVNSASGVRLPRCIGERNSVYNLICFTDASKKLYGVVVYLQSLDSQKLNFVMSKSRVINRQLSNKGVPSLEFQAVALGTEVLINMYEELAGDKTVVPIKINRLMIYTDSMVSLNWLNSYHLQMAKMQSKRSVFIMNRLSHIGKLCEIHPITYRFITGRENPADFATRPTSCKILLSSNYLSGPSFLSQQEETEQLNDISVTVPFMDQGSDFTRQCMTAFGKAKCDPLSDPVTHLISLESQSSFRKLVSVYANVLKFVNILKYKLKLRFPSKTHILSNSAADFNFIAEATDRILLCDQRIHFPECFEYFFGKQKNLKDIPNIVTQLNVYCDSKGLLRVRSKCGGRVHRTNFVDPILLSKRSDLSRMIVRGLHEKLSHVGRYTVLSELRKQYYIPKIFSLVKEVVRKCVKCRRFNERTIKVNQSPYREFRINPPSIPYRTVFIDYLGPFFVKLAGSKVKIWLLCISCLWSRSVNLELCLDLSVENFLRALQLHINEHGLPALILSDSGSQLTAASNVILTFLKDPDTDKYLKEHNISGLEFKHYCKGNESLGSLVEICVKMVKRLIHGAIGKNVLSYFEFESVVSSTINLVNKRPIAFKDALRDCSGLDVPDPITPELLVHGHVLPTINVNPALASDDLTDADFSHANIKSSYTSLQRVRSRLVDLYNAEFLTNLISQATDVKDRYRPVCHKRLSVGDIVLLKEKHLKSSDYPMGIVREVQVNELDEVTGATIWKGKTRELVRRHVNSLILLLSPQHSSEHTVAVEERGLESASSVPRPVRNAALRCKEKNAGLAEANLL